MEMPRVSTQLSEMLARITGISIGADGFGVEWEPTPTERTVARRLVHRFENHRVLWFSGCGRNPGEMIRSLQELRDDLTIALDDLGEDSVTSAAVRQFRRECMEFQSRLDELSFRPDGTGAPPEDFWIELGAFRTNFGATLRFVLVCLELTTDDNLSRILPKGSENNRLI
jgi:hypothetical protein